MFKTSSCLLKSTSNLRLDDPENLRIFGVIKNSK